MAGLSGAAEVAQVGQRDKILELAQRRHEEDDRAKLSGSSIPICSGIGKPACLVARLQLNGDVPRFLLAHHGQSDRGANLPIVELGEERS